MIGNRADFDLPRRQGLKAYPSGQELSDGALLRAEDDRFVPEQPPDQILSGEDVVPVHGVPDQLVHAVLREVVYYGCGERPATQDGLLIRRIASGHPITERAHRNSTRHLDTDGGDGLYSLRAGYTGPEQ